MASPAAEDITKRPSSSTSSSSSNKRSHSSRDLTLPRTRTPPNIQSLLHIPEDAIWSLRKQDLRTAFLTLQQYARNPYPLTEPPEPPALLSTISTSTTISTPVPTLLRLPLEIRELIYKHLLPSPCDPPVRGPHPRQLQTHIHLTQLIPSTLLHLNHQIRSEALPILYGSPTQIVHITIDYNVWLHKTRRSELVLSSALTSAIRHVHLSIHLGSEKRTSKPGDVEAEARVTEVKKGIKKCGKWLAGADVQSLRVSWQEPPQTYTWEQKKEILDGVKVLRPVKVEVGEINWGLNWNKGRKYRFETEYLKSLERGRQAES